MATIKYKITCVISLQDRADQEEPEFSAFKDELFPCPLTWGFLLSCSKMLVALPVLPFFHLRTLACIFLKLPLRIFLLKPRLHVLTS